MPWVRAVATSRARPALASQAEKAKRSIGAAEYPVASSWRDHSERAIKSESIMPSKQSSADKRCVRWNARPINPRINAELKLKCTGVIRGLRTLTVIF